MMVRLSSTNYGSIEGSLSFSRSIMLAAITSLMMIAPAKAQWPQPNSLQLFGKFDCQIATAPTCLCSRDGNRSIVYQQLLEIVAAYPVPFGGETARKAVQTKWRRQCGLLEEEDTAP